jgi:hypothetical protein
MRMKLFSETSGTLTPLPNPNPIRFKVVRTTQVGPHLVAKVNYPDCVTYDGDKILVFLDKTAAALRNLSKLDPHFSEHDWSPFARFAPTSEGMSAALLLAKNLPG